MGLAGPQALRRRKWPIQSYDTTAADLSALQGCLVTLDIKPLVVRCLSLNDLGRLWGVSIPVNRALDTELVVAQASVKWLLTEEERERQEVKDRGDDCDLVVLGL